MTVLRDMPAIDRVIFAESWEFLVDNWPALAQAVQEEVERGAQPADVRRHVLKLVGENRAPIALRCQQAAAHLRNGNDNA